MIKLQLLLRQPLAEPGADPALRARLEAHGMTLTGEGRATLSVTMSDEDFKRLFGPPKIAAGFTMGPYEPPALQIPADLSGAIQLITVAPHNPAMI